MRHPSSQAFNLTFPQHSLSVPIISNMCDMDYGHVCGWWALVVGGHMRRFPRARVSSRPAESVVPEKTSRI